MKQDVRAGGQGLQVRRAGRHARGEHESRLAALDGGERLLEPGLGGVALPDVEIAVRHLGGGTVLESGGQMDRRRNRAGRRIDRPSGMHRDGLEAQVAPFLVSAGL